MSSKSLFIGLCVCLILIGCDSGTDDNELKIGIVLPATGTISEAGEEVSKGIALALDEVLDSGLLGNTITSASLDNKSTTDGSTAAYNTLINDVGTPVILGPVTSSATDAIISIADGAGVVAFSPTSSATGLSAKSDWLFRSSLTVDQLVPVGIEVSKAHLNYRRVATIVNSGDTFSMSSNDKIMEVLQADPDITIVSAQSYSRPPGTEIGDLTTELTAVMNADPDAIFLSGLPEDHFGILTQGHILGITNTPYIATLFAINDVQRINAEVPGAAEGAVTFQVWLESSDEPLSREFVNSYTARHGEAPSDYAARGYAAFHILAEALENAENYEAASIRSALAAVKNLDTIYGPFSFDGNGDAMYNPVVAQVRDNAFVVLQQ